MNRKFWRSTNDIANVNMGVVRVINTLHVYRDWVIQLRIEDRDCLWEWFGLHDGLVKVQKWLWECEGQERLPAVLHSVFINHYCPLRGPDGSRFLQLHNHPPESSLCNGLEFSLATYPGPTCEKGEGLVSTACAFANITKIKVVNMYNSCRKALTCVHLYTCEKKCRSMQAHM